MTKIFFACDVHGSEITWKKFLDAGPKYADIIMLCGDLTGKVMVPIVKRKNEEWFCHVYGKEQIMHSKEELERTLTNFHNRGFYTFETNLDEVDELRANASKRTKLFVELMKETMVRWLNMANEKVPKNVSIIVNPGNDDSFGIDSVIEDNERIVYPLNRTVSIAEKYTLVSCEWVNETPWKTPRECNEKELMKKLEREFGRTDDFENLVCNFHAPPYDTNLDLAPKLSKDLKPDYSALVPVGSTSVRKSIEEHQPLLTLHGHIHESCSTHRLGRTLCVNPGSEYDSGVLRAYVIDLPKLDFWRVEA